MPELVLAVAGIGAIPDFSEIGSNRQDQPRLVPILVCTGDHALRQSPKPLR